MNFLANIKNVVIAAILALAIGFAVGFYVKGKFEKAAQVNAIITAQHQTATNIQQSLKQSLAVESEISASNQSVGIIREAVVSRIRAEEAHHAIVSLKISHDLNQLPEQPQANVLPCGRDTLDIGTVRLLNDALYGAIDRPTGGSDASGAASAIVGAIH